MTDQWVIENPASPWVVEPNYAGVRITTTRAVRLTEEGAVRITEDFQRWIKE